MSYTLFCCRCGRESQKFTMIDARIFCHKCWDEEDFFVKAKVKVDSSGITHVNFKKEKEQK